MPHCIVCKTQFDHASYSSPAEPCDCGQCWQYHPEDEQPPDPKALATARAVWAAGDVPVCANYAEGDCETPLDAVRDYNEVSPLPDKHYLCETCYCRRAEDAYERQCDNHYGGSR